MDTALLAEQFAAAAAGLDAALKTASGVDGSEVAISSHINFAIRLQHGGEDVGSISFFVVEKDDERVCTFGVKLEANIRRQGIGDAALATAEKLAQTLACTKLLTSLSGLGKLAFAQQRPAARLAKNNPDAFYEQWREYSSETACPATLGELPEAFLKDCSSFVVEWEVPG